MLLRKATRLRRIRRVHQALLIDMEPDDSTLPQFWSTRYAARRTPWDLHGVPEALRGFLARSRAPGSVLIPGCGSGYEVRAFHDAGFDVTALDFSPVAIERAQEVLGPLSSKVHLGDFFTHDFEDRRFDLIYERTFLCSMPSSRWRDYAARMSALLVPAGRLVGIFLYGKGSDPATVSDEGSAGRRFPGQPIRSQPK